MRKHNYLFLITITFFLLGFVNIHFSLLGIVCMTLPVILLLRDRKKTWCQSYCPRADLYTTCGRAKQWKSLKTPQFFIKGNMKWIMLTYFSISLTFILISTLNVASGKKLPMEALRFFILIPIPFEMPQFFDIMNTAPWLIHLSYRFYSMMLTTTVLGLVLAMIYKPRTWCTICPIATVSDVILKKRR